MESDTVTVKDNETRILRLEKAFEKLSGIVVGNGARGMDEVVRAIEKEIEKQSKRMDALENANGITNSELYHLRTVYFQREGLDALGNPIEKTWLRKTWENNIAPNLLNNAVTAIIIIVVWNLNDLLELMAALSK